MTALVTVVALVLGLEGPALRVDQGLLDGLRQGDRGIVHYTLTVGAVEKTIADHGRKRPSQPAQIDIGKVYPASVVDLSIFLDLYIQPQRIYSCPRCFVIESYFAVR